MQNRLRFVVNLFFAICCVTAMHSTVFAEPTNLHDVKESLKVYHDSGEYDKEIAQVALRADQYIHHQVEINTHRHHPLKLAIVLDIDETSLSSYDFMLKNQFCYKPVAHHRELLRANAPAIKPVLTLYQHALVQHVSVFFITARPSDTYQATVRNLKSAGFNKWTKLYTLPFNYKDPSRWRFKQHTRAMIEKKGFTIIASIGDQRSDHQGGYALKTFKLPNPYYYIP